MPSFDRNYRCNVNFLVGNACPLFHYSWIRGFPARCARPEDNSERIRTFRPQKLSSVARREKKHGYCHVDTRHVRRSKAEASVEHRRSIADRSCSAPPPSLPLPSSPLYSKESKTRSELIALRRLAVTARARDKTSVFPQQPDPSPPLPSPRPARSGLLYPVRCIGFLAVSVTDVYRGDRNKLRTRSPRAIEILIFTLGFLAVYLVFRSRRFVPPLLLLLPLRSESARNTWRTHTLGQSQKRDHVTPR